MSKSIILQKRVSTFSKFVFDFFEKITYKMMNLLITMKMFPKQISIINDLREMLHFLHQYRSETIEFFLDLGNMLKKELTQEMVRDLYKKSTGIITSSDSIIRVITIGSNPFCSLPIQKASLSVLVSVLSHVPYNEECETGPLDFHVQEQFELIFLKRYKKISNSLNNLKVVFRAKASFSNVEGFCRAIATSIIDDFKLDCYISQLVLCITRYVYPQLYVFQRDFFKIATQLSQKPIEIPSCPHFLRGLSELNQIHFKVVPIDMLYSMYIASTAFVRSFFIENNCDPNTECGAQQLLPIIEKAILSTSTNTIPSVIRWLEKYNQEVQCTPALAYVITSFVSALNVTLSKLN